MEKSIFPKKFNADINLHEKSLEELYRSIHGSIIIELACGSGSISRQLPSDNSYTGIDISPGLIKTALKRFSGKGFTDPQFFISDASDLPFKDSIFDICICNLSLNFFPDISASAAEINRILKQAEHSTAASLFLKENRKKVQYGEPFFLHLNLKKHSQKQDLILQHQTSAMEQFFILKQ